MKVLFVVEGFKVAVLVTSGKSGRRIRNRSFPSPESALSWARQKRASLVYLPTKSAAQNLRALAQN